MTRRMVLVFIRVARGDEVEEASRGTAREGCLGTPKRLISGRGMACLTTLRIS